MFVIALPLVAQDRGYMRDVRWTSGERTASALWLFRPGEARHEVSMLAASPAGTRYVFRRTWNANGIMRTRMTHDATGWWIELTTDFRVSRPSFEAFARALDPGALPDGHTVTLALKTSARTALEPVAVPYAPDGDEYEALAAHLTGPDAAEVRKQLPAGLAADLEFFDGAFTADNALGFEFRSVIVALRELLGERKAPARVEVHAGKAARGTIVMNEQGFEFVRAFRTLDNPTDPMPPSP